jgi:nitrite reductase/ring-hydroxylating ferredoxin subunit
MPAPPEGYRRVGTLERVMDGPRAFKTREGQAIVVFYHRGQLYAVENRCPHVGYPLDSGTLDEGVVTCLWHQAKFELATGKSLDAQYEDINTYPVTAVDGEVWVKPVPNQK